MIMNINAVVALISKESFPHGWAFELVKENDYPNNLVEIIISRDVF